jgi:lipoyl(octanoyl) transferase
LFCDSPIEHSVGSFAVIVQPLRQWDYLDCLQAMRQFTAQRSSQTPDEVWLVEHPPVFTLGLAGKPEHLLSPGNIPIVQTERGGQVTFHGPGQLVAYTLLDLRRHKLTVKGLVQLLERSAITYFDALGINTAVKAGAPGVYTESGAKIASLGLKISRGCSFHGIALNIDMDLTPFNGINPCGYPGLEVTDVKRALSTKNAPTLAQASTSFAAQLHAQINLLRQSV